MAISYALNHTVAGNRSQILQRLMLLRLAMLGTIICALGVFYWYLERGLNYPMLMAAIAAGSAHTYWVYSQIRKSSTATDFNLLSHLLVDAALLLAVVLFTGRSANPFIYYLLVLVAISAAIFNYRISWLFCGASIFVYSGLLYGDVKGHFDHMSDDFQLHLLGMWINFVGSAVLINFFVSRLATALRDRQILLAKAREDTLKNEQLIGIGTLAASTVHALGTPLSTMAVLLGEMKGDNGKDEDLQDNIALMLNQVDRCKRTMNKLSLLAGGSEKSNIKESVEDFITDLQSHYNLVNPRVPPDFTTDPDTRNLVIASGLLLRHALINLIDNAVRAAHTKVAVQTCHHDNTIHFKIMDDGDGLPLEVIENWGKPYFSSQHGGLGIGTFLANSTIERLGGSVKLYNATPQNGKLTTLLVALPADISTPAPNSSLSLHP